MSITSILELYGRGVITEYETCQNLIDRVSAEDIHNLSQDWKVRLKEYLSRFPKGKALDNCHIRTFSIIASAGPLPQETEEDKAHFKSKIRFVRAELAFQDLKLHMADCDQCLVAARGRFASATTEQINERRCKKGRKLAEAAFNRFLNEETPMRK